MYTSATVTAPFVYVHEPSTSSQSKLIVPEWDRKGIRSTKVLFRCFPVVDYLLASDSGWLIARQMHTCITLVFIYYHLRVVRFLTAPSSGEVCNKPSLQTVFPIVSAKNLIQHSLRISHRYWPSKTAWNSNQLHFHHPTIHLLHALPRRVFHRSTTIVLMISMAVSKDTKESLRRLASLHREGSWW